MSLRRLVLAALVVTAVSYSATADDPAPTTSAAPAAAANASATTPAASAPTTAATPTTTTPATPISTGAATLPPVVGLDTDSAADAVSETFLTLTLAYFNQSYLGSGIFADTVAAEAYESEDSKELLGAQVELAQQVEQQIESLAKAPGHDREDLEVIEGFKKLAQLNRIQWETLRDVLGGDESKSKIWNEVRDTLLKELEVYGEEEPAAETTPAAPTTGAPTAGPTAPTTK